MTTPIFFKFPTYHVLRPEQNNKKQKILSAAKGPTPIYADIGASLAPSHILDKEFLKNFPVHEIHEISHMVQQPRPLLSYGSMLDEVGKIYASISEQIRLTMKHATRAHHADDVLVMIGGDHSVSSTSLAATLDAVDPDKYGVLYIDSHGDLHRKSTSPSGSYHGMWMRPHLDNKGVGIHSFDSYIYRKIQPQNVMYVGNLDLEPQEAEYMRDHKIQVVTKEEFVNDLPHAIKRVTDFLDRLHYAHTTVDIDVLDKRFAPGTGLPAEDGLYPEHILPLVEYAGKKHVRSIDLVEVYPQKDIDRKTVLQAQEILKTYLFASSVR